MSKTSSKNNLKTESRISEMQTQMTTLEENWKRALADYQNLLRRVENDRKEFTKISNANIIARLLPSLDIIELAANHNQDLGVQMSAKQFHQALVDEGLEIILPAVGESFDPKIHDCSETVDLGEGKVENTISELILKGYKLGDYVLRPAKVKVYKTENK
jgi:molecular chaperone GrpE